MRDFTQKVNLLALSVLTLGWQTATAQSHWAAAVRASAVEISRVMYEQASVPGAVNKCPPGMFCTAVIIREKVEFSAWHAAIVPRYESAKDRSVFGTLGAQRWEPKRDVIVPDDSGTGFAHGAGNSWRVMPSADFAFEYQTSDVEYDAIHDNRGYRF